MRNFFFSKNFKYADVLEQNKEMEASSNETIEKFYNEAQLVNDKDSNENEYNLKLSDKLNEMSAPFQNKQESIRFVWAVSKSK